MNGLLQDLRHAVRALLKSPGLLVSVTFILAAGLGLNTAVFSIVNAVLIRPLPYQDPERLVTLWGRVPAQDLPQLTVSPPEFQDYRNQQSAFQSMAAYASTSFNLTGTGDPERLTGTWNSAGMFELLGVQPILGRTFRKEEDQFGGEKVAILSYELWYRLFSLDRNVVGRRIIVNGEPHTVIGVMPSDFRFPERETAAWFPLAFGPEDFSENQRGSHWLRVVARMKEGKSLAQAEADVSLIARRMQQEHPGDYLKDSGWDAYLIPLREVMIGDVKPLLLVLLGSVGFVLLIACANVANILLARSIRRHREIAVRAALGAGRLRLIRHMLTESVLLSLLGGGAGALLAVWGTEWLSRFGPREILAVRGIAVDYRVLLFGFGLSTLAGLVVGLVPAWHAGSVHLLESLAQGGRSTSASAGHARIRDILIASEVAVALILLMGAGLMIKSLYRLTSVDPGFRFSGTTTMKITLPAIQYPEPASQRRFFQQLLDRLNSVADVESSGMINHLPLGGTDNDRDFSIEGRGHMLLNIGFRMIGGEYFRAMGIPVLKGRSFSPADHENAPAAVLINQTMERIFFAGQDAVGKRIKLGLPGGPFPWMTIIGVVQDVKHGGLDHATAPEIYVSYRQPLLPDFRSSSFSVIVHSRSEQAVLADTLRREVSALDKNLPVYQIATMDQLLAQSLAPRRFNTNLFVLFALLASLMAAAGIYGVVAFSVSQRFQEIGIRAALGAARADIFRLILGRGLVLTLAGVAAGAAGALVLMRLLTSLLFQVSASDPATYLLAACFLSLVTLLATAIPAAHAARIDPASALRQE